MRRPRPTSLALRRAFRRTAAASLLIALIGGLGAIVLTDRAATSAARAQVAQEAAIFVHLEADEGHAALVETIGAISRPSLPQENRIGLFTLQGNKLAGGLDIAPEAPGWSDADGLMIHTVRIGDDLLSLARPMDARRAVRRTLLMSVPVIILMQLGAALLLMASATRSIELKLDETDAAFWQFLSGDLSTRIPTHDPPKDRIDVLHVRINEGMARIETLIGTVRRTSAAIAHDLRTPLTRASLSIESARDAPEGADAHLAGALREIRGMVEISEAILRLADIEATSTDEAFASFDLSALVDEIRETYEPLLEDQGGHIRTDLPDGPVPVRADRRMIGQALVNLLENAIRHCHDSVRIVLHLSVVRHAVTLAVIDDGPGVAEADIGRIFEPHFRADAARASRGLGLGLAIVKAVAERHGGQAVARRLDPGFGILLTMPILARGANLTSE